MIHRLLARWRKPQVVSIADYTDFLERNAWLVTQKSVIGYCHVKTKLPVHELMWDKPFEDAYEISVRHAHAAALADLMEMSLGYMKSAASGRGSDIADCLVDIFCALQVRQIPLPNGEPISWVGETESLRARLHDAVAKPPRPFSEISLVSAERIFETLPFHPRLRAPDKPAIVAGVQFLMVGLAHEFERIDHESLVAEMLSPAKTTE